MGVCEKHSSDCYLECRNYQTGVPEPNPDQCGVVPPDNPDVEPPECPASIENGCERKVQTKFIFC